MARIELKSWTAVGVWKYNIKEDKCAIDKQSLQSVCMNCESLGSCDKAQCAIDIGECKHAFHAHCIRPWIEKNQRCALCNKTWVHLKSL